MCALVAISGLAIGAGANRLRLVGPDKFIGAPMTRADDGSTNTAGPIVRSPSLRSNV